MEISNHRGIRILGAMIALGSVAITFYCWQQFLGGAHIGRRSQMAFFLFPFFTMLGFMLALDPVTKAEMRLRHGTDQLTWKHMSLRQKALIVAGAILGVLNWLAMQYLSTPNSPY